MLSSSLDEGRERQSGQQLRYARPAADDGEVPRKGQVVNSSDARQLELGVLWSTGWGRAMLAESTGHALLDRSSVEE